MMHNDLIVTIFEQRQDALLARQALELMRDQALFGLEHAAEVTRDSAGQTMVHHRWELVAYPRNPRHHLASILSDAIFGYGEEAKHARLTAAGLDEYFLSKVRQALVPNSSALLVYVPKDGTANAYLLVQALSILQGTVHRTTVSEEAVNRIVDHLRLY